MVAVPLLLPFPVPVPHPADRAVGSPADRHPWSPPWRRTFRSDRSDESWLPSLRQIARRAVPQAIEASIIPAVIILVLSNVASPMVAIAAAFGWALLTTLWRSVTRRRVSGLSVLAITRLFVRSTIAIAAGSTFVYFVQGSIGGFCLALAFLVSVAIDRPLARRFATDLTDLPERILEHRLVRRGLRRISLMWGLIGLAHAGVGLWLLLNLSTDAYVVVNTLLSVGVPAAAIAVSASWFRRVVEAVR